MSMSNTKNAVKETRHNTRRKHSTEDKIRIVLEGIRGEMSIAELCRRSQLFFLIYRSTTQPLKRTLPSSSRTSTCRQMAVRLPARSRVPSVIGPSSWAGYVAAGPVLTLSNGAMTL